MERVVITGIGMLTPCGLTTESTWDALCAAKSGVAPIQAYDATGHKVQIAGEVTGFDAAEHLSKKQRKESGRFAHLAVVAARDCLKDAGIELTDTIRDQCGTLIGVGLGGLSNLYQQSIVLHEKGAKRLSPYFIPTVIANLAAGQVAIDLGLRGPSYCTTSACSSSAHAIGEAADWIRLGRTPIMLAGGAEATITELGVGGFAAMFALSQRNDAPEEASRPWDVDRDGFVCGEGAACLMLEAESHAVARGARIYAEVSGYGATCDAHHITSPAPEGEGGRRAMAMALRMAGLNPEQVDYINAHGTSTPQGDMREAQAITNLFGDHATSKKLWVSSTKSAMGHLLGAAGAVETAVSALACQDGRVPPTLNLHQQDPECLLDCVPLEGRERPVRHALSNSFGFGGTNVSLVVSRYGS